MQQIPIISFILSLANALLIYNKFSSLIEQVNRKLIHGKIASLVLLNWAHQCQIKLSALCLKLSWLHQTKVNHGLQVFWLQLRRDTRIENHKYLCSWFLSYLSDTSKKHHYGLATELSPVICVNAILIHSNSSYLTINVLKILERNTLPISCSTMLSYLP